MITEGVMLLIKCIKTKVEDKNCRHRSIEAIEILLGKCVFYLGLIKLNIF